MEYSSILHHMDKRFCFSVGEGKLLIRIKTRKNDISKIILHYQDKYLSAYKLDGLHHIEMKKAVSDIYCDYFEATIEFRGISVKYFFELTDMNGERKFYGNYLFYDKKITNNDRMFDSPRYIKEVERLDVPKWAHNKVVYQIFPSRFATSKQIEEKKWYKAPIGYADNLQGDLQGLMGRLEHIKELGIEVIYMTPIFRSDSMHKYDTIDYYEIDPSFGTKEDLRTLVDTAHKMGIRVILDAVFNHSSPKFFAFADIMEKGENSEYKNWYFIEDFPLKMGRMVKPNFLTFGYFCGMPKLNLCNPQTEQYFIDVGKYWVREFNIDGWRLDVGDEVAHRFWKRFREEIKDVNPEALIIGETWRYAGEFLEGDEWDTIMNYSFYLSVIDFVAEERVRPSEFLGSLGFMRGNLHPDCYNSLLNLIDSHDTPRFMNLCDKNRRKHMLAAALQLLTPGMPMIYYGDEFGMQGGADPDCRRGMVWNEKYQDREIFEWYKTLIKTRKEHISITEGDVVYDGTDDDRNIIIQTKKCGKDEVTLIFHNTSDNVELTGMSGKINTLTNEIFDGVVKGYEALVLI